MRLLTAALASARSIAMTDKPSTRRPRGGAVKEILKLCYPLAMKDRDARE
jgi:hypothetical protein